MWEGGCTPSHAEHEEDFAGIYIKWKQYFKDYNNYYWKYTKIVPTFSIYSNKIFSNFFHIIGVSKILMNVSLFDECKYVLTTLSAENDPSEVADMIGTLNIT